MTAREIRTVLKNLGDPEKARVLQRYFKTGSGEYGQGDIFVGVRVPDLRRLAGRCYRDMAPAELRSLLSSSIHEERLLALLILVRRFEKGDEAARGKIYQLYLKSTRHINNWDLVDTTAGHIVGAFLSGKSRAPLVRLARSTNLWERRIAIIATFYFIKNRDFSDTLKIAKMLLQDPEDLIHKAVGWMLREVGKRHRPTEENFLKKHYHAMPRTMLRYAIERLPQPRRLKYLKGTI